MANDPFLSAYAFEKLFHLPRLRLTIEKAEAAYKTLEPETIDWCKSIIESMCKQVLREKDPDYNDDEKTELPKLIKAALEKAGIGNDQIRGGITSLVNAIAQIRNDQTVAGHGLMGSKPLVSRTEIQLFVSTFEHLTRIFLILIQRNEPDIRHTSIAFDELERQLELGDFNSELDTSVEVEYDQEEGVLFIEGKELRPSEILYHFDRETYAVKIQFAQQENLRAEEEEAEQLQEQARSEIEHQLCEGGVFDNFSPGHYGYDIPEIWIDDIKVDRNEDIATASGTISTSVRLGDSSDEDGFDIEYSSGFAAIFAIQNDEDDDTFDLELQELVLEKTDWYGDEPGD